MTSDPTVNPLHDPTLLGGAEPFVIILHPGGMSSGGNDFFSTLSTPLWMACKTVPGRNEKAYEFTFLEAP